MNPTATLFLDHGQYVQLYKIFHSSVIKRVEIATQGSTESTCLPISYGPDFPSEKLKQNRIK